MSAEHSPDATPNQCAGPCAQPCKGNPTCHACSVQAANAAAHEEARRAVVAMGPSADRVVVTPAVRTRLEALGYSPGTTEANPVTWLVGTLEKSHAHYEQACNEWAVTEIALTRHAASLQAELKAAQADLATLRSALRRALPEAGPTDEALVAAATARTTPQPAGTVEERIAALCGLVPGLLGDRIPIAWGTPDGAWCVWRDAMGWPWNAGDGLHGREMRPESALRAYAAARGVDLSGLDAPANTDRAQVAALGAQPAPSGGTGDCWAELIAHAGPDHPLRAKMEDRRAFGLRKYKGVPVTRNDGRDAERDLFEELLDGAVYAWRLDRRGLAMMLLDLATNDGEVHLLSAEEAERARGWSARELAVWDAVLDDLEAAEMHTSRRVVAALVGVTCG